MRIINAIAMSQAIATGIIIGMLIYSVIKNRIKRARLASRLKRSRADFLI